MAFTSYDLSKNFDCVDHHRLLEKLEILNFFSSYLLDRKQCVGSHHNFSSIKNIIYDVPQGLVLDHIIFIMYIIVYQLLRDICLLYADDTYLLNKFHIRKEFLVPT